MISLGWEIERKNKELDRCLEDENLCTVQLEERSLEPPASRMYGPSTSQTKISEACYVFLVDRQFSVVKLFLSLQYRHSRFRKFTEGRVYLVLQCFCSVCFSSSVGRLILMEPLKNLCFETGDMFYNMTKRFSEAVQEYNEADTALSEELN